MSRKPAAVRWVRNGRCDENVIRSREGNIFVVDCDIRINVPELKTGGTRTFSTDIVIKNV
jgi:hypothetical protein